MNTQQQEDMDYQMGCANELQNALAQSRMEFDNGWAVIQQAIDSGLFVVASVCPVFCRRTDAALGVQYGLYVTCASREDAQKEADRLNREYSDEDFGYAVFPYATVVFVPLTDADVPF